MLVDRTPSSPSSELLSVSSTSPVPPAALSLVEFSVSAGSRITCWVAVEAEGSTHAQVPYREATMLPCSFSARIAWRQQFGAGPTYQHLSFFTRSFFFFATRQNVVLRDGNRHQRNPQQTHHVKVVVIPDLRSLQCNFIHCLDVGPFCPRVAPPRVLLIRVHLLGLSICREACPPDVGNMAFFYVNVLRNIGRPTPPDKCVLPAQITESTL